MVIRGTGIGGEPKQLKIAQAGDRGFREDVDFGSAQKVP